MENSADENTRRTREARAAVEASLAIVGKSVDAELRTRAADLHDNSTVIAQQERELANNTKALAKEADKLQQLADTSMKQLNEVGHVQNWAEMIERDLLVIEETIRLAEGRASSPHITDHTGGAGTNE